MYVNTGDGLNLRVSPKVSSQKICNLPIFTEVTVIEKNNDYTTIDGIKSQWVKVKSGNNIGWVFGGYLSETADEMTNLLGEWQSEYHWYRFRNDGTFLGGRNSSGLMWFGKWTLANGILYMNGKTGDEFDIVDFTDKADLIFIDDSQINIILHGRNEEYYRNIRKEIYKRTVLDWLTR
jgi:hypothetical protein